MRGARPALPLTRGDWVVPAPMVFYVVTVLPKNQDIAAHRIMCTLHKALTRLRWDLVADWVQSAREQLWYDAAYPGCTLDVYQNRHRLTIFLDLTTCYESIEHEQLIRDAKRMGFPASVLLWVLHAYTGPDCSRVPKALALRSTWWLDARPPPSFPRSRSRHHVRGFCPCVLSSAHLRVDDISAAACGQ